MDILRENIKSVLEREGFILNSFNEKEAVFQKENIQIDITDLNCKIYEEE